MENKTSGSVHWSFWLIGAVALIWNAMGVMNFMAQMFAGDLSFMPEWWRAVIESRPLWATVAMAVAVFGGVLGAILLLLRKSAAIYLFILSLNGAVLAIVHAVGVAGAGPRQIFEAVVMPVVVAGFMIWYAKLARRRGWFNPRDTTG